MGFPYFLQISPMEKQKSKKNSLLFVLQNGKPILDRSLVSRVVYLYIDADRSLQI